MGDGSCWAAFTGSRRPASECAVVVHRLLPCEDHFCNTHCNASHVFVFVDVASRRGSGVPEAGSIGSNPFTSVDAKMPFIGPLAVRTAS